MNEFVQRLDRRLELRCPKLHLVVEFTLNHGDVARIGRSPDLEISLPILGISERECELSCDAAGRIWLSRTVNVRPIQVGPPGEFQIGPYRVLLSEVGSSEKNKRRKPRPVVEAEFPNKLRRIYYAIAAAFALLLVASFLAFRENYRTDTAASTHTKGKPMAENRSSTNSEPDELSPDLNAPSADFSRGRSKAEPKLSKDQTWIDNVVSSERDQPLDLAGLAKRVEQSVLLIEARDASGDVASTGTGFFISSDGFVATNYHVIENGLEFSAVTGQGARFAVSRVVAVNKDADLAILQAEGIAVVSLALGSSDSVSVGDRVALFGSPKGLSGTLTEGIISAKRVINEKLIPNGGKLLQTTAPASPGSSGSPLLDLTGRVIGILTRASSGHSQNLNFAVPVEALITLKAEADSALGGTDGVASNSGISSTKGKSDPNRSYANDPAYNSVKEQLSAREWVAVLKQTRTLRRIHDRSTEAQFDHAFAAHELGLRDEAESSY